MFFPLVLTCTVVRLTVLPSCPYSLIDLLICIMSKYTIFLIRYQYHCKPYCDAMQK